ncbi:Putative NAD(P)-dependent oxidoreductase EC-YbbO [hydrothermal vent metagenome]|uniref:NAD(P)-dependent oxidoreductase EC-YbbO n=1 Tax=hydrothermal vent metagenome TaxID=652676 RepID=A0A3B1CEE6_9ZZZZ
MFWFGIVCLNKFFFGDLVDGVSEFMGKSILITGCSSGIGFCVAKGLKDRGYQTLATCRRDEDVERLKELGFDSFKLDLADSSSIKKAVAQTIQKTGGRLFALFNNGAYGMAGAVEDLSRDAIREQFEVNLFGTMELTNLLIPVMRKHFEGRIIQNSSVLGLVSLPYRGAYNASKFALEGLTDAMRLELSDSGIYVSLIESGPILSNFRKNVYKAFNRHIDPSKSVHAEIYKTLEHRLTREGAIQKGTLPPEAVLKKVIHALESDSPKIRYYVTIHTHIAAILKRALPFGMLDWVIKREG